MANLKVAVLANLKKIAPKFPGMAEDHWADLDSESTVEALVAAIKAGGHQAVFREGNADLYDQLRADRPDLCFNICEGHFGDGREAQVPAMLEMLRLPYTGSRVLSSPRYTRSRGRERCSFHSCRVRQMLVIRQSACW